MNANCWTCRRASWHRYRCTALRDDDTRDSAIQAWLRAAPLRDDGTVPGNADGCPGWEPRSGCVLAGVPRG